MIQRPVVTLLNPNSTNSPRNKRRHAPWRGLFVGGVVVIVSLGAFAYLAIPGHGGGKYHIGGASAPPATDKTVSKLTTPKSSPQGALGLVATAAPASTCSANTLSKLIIISINKRHLWACNGTSQVHDSPVVTGMQNLAADLTPTGTYHVYGKQTNLYLKGSDSTGSWNAYVYYWMPFLSNQYGVYGFHDATWRKASDFGNISPYSSGASHGCVELPLAAAKWVYNWASIGTTLKVES